jgi:hypothetical protein
MKAIIEFELPQDAIEHQTALDGWKWRMILNEVSESIRHDLKYTEMPTEAYKALDSLRGFIFQRMAEENLSFD